jgi:hypothetical protein
MAKLAKTEMGIDALDVLADRGYFDSEEILACEPIGVTPYLPKPSTSGAKAGGRFGKQDFVYIPDDDVYRCPAGERLTWHFTSVEQGLNVHKYWTSNCAGCALKDQCTPGKQRRVRRWEHEAVIDAMQERLDRAPNRFPPSPPSDPVLCQLPMRGNCTDFRDGHSLRPIVNPRKLRTLRRRVSRSHRSRTTRRPRRMRYGHIRDNLGRANRILPSPHRIVRLHIRRRERVL